MKRSLLIAGGAIGGFGAVLMITPPNLSETTQISGGIPQVDPTAAPSNTAQPGAKPTKKPSATDAPQPSGAKDGTYTGDAVTIRYGTVQVKITVQGGKIVDAQAVQAPSGSNDRYTQKAVPVLREQTIAAQSANIQGVSGASFTAYGWYTSLASAIAKAGL
jgi:uncharacterized protein with FMN-binding domain